MALANPALARLTGYEPAELAGQDLRLLAGPATDVAALTGMRQAMAEGRPSRTLLKSYRKDGQLFWNDVATAPVHDAAGRLTHYVTVQSDVTRLVEAPELEAARAIEEQVAARTEELEGTLAHVERPAPLRRDDPQQHGLGDPRDRPEGDRHVREPRRAAHARHERRRLRRPPGGRALRRPRGGGRRGLRQRPGAQRAPPRLPHDQPGRDPVLRRDVDHAGAARAAGRGGLHLPVPRPRGDDRPRDGPAHPAARVRGSPARRRRGRTPESRRPTLPAAPDESLPPRRMVLALRYTAPAEIARAAIESLCGRLEGDGAFVRLETGDDVPEVLLDRQQAIEALVILISSVARPLHGPGGGPRAHHAPGARRQGARRPRRPRAWRSTGRPPGSPKRT